MQEIESSNIYKQNSKKFEIFEDCLSNCDQINQIKRNSTMPTLSDPCEKRYSDEYLDQLDIKLTKLIKKKSRKQKNQIPKKKIDVFETKIVDDVQDLWLKYSPFQKSDEFHSNSIEIFNEISIKSDVLKRENDDLKAFFDFLITTKVV